MGVGTPYACERPTNHADPSCQVTEKEGYEGFSKRKMTAGWLRGCKSFQRKGNQKRKEAWSMFICTPSSSHCIAFVPVATLCQEPDKASLGWTILVSLYVAKDEAAFTF